MPLTLSATQQKQTKIMDIALDLFLEHGYDAVSLDDILEQSGGSKTTLYSYYGGKEGLFAAVVKKTCHDKTRHLMTLQISEMDPRSGLNTVGLAFLTMVSEPTGQALYRMLISEAERFPKLAREFYAAGPETLIKLIKSNLENWQKARLLRAGNAETMAVQFIGIMLGNFSAKSLLCLSPRLTDKEIKEWVAKGVTLFLEGACGPR